MRQAPAALLAAVFGVVLCVAVAVPWYSYRASVEQARPGDAVQRILERAHPSLRTDRPSVGLVPDGVGFRALLWALFGTVFAILLATVQDRLDDPVAKGFAGASLLGFGGATFFSAARLASGAEWMSFGGWARVTTANLVLCLGASFVATAFAVVAYFARRAKVPREV